MKKIIILLILITNVGVAADIPALTQLFKDNYNTIYKARYCGINTENFYKLAKRKGINLDNTFVYHIKGGGFLETSGFYTRKTEDERDMLGYFHVVLVADEYVFDFDLRRPIVLNFTNYTRLQFTPTDPSYRIWGVLYSKENPSNWKVSIYHPEDFIGRGEIEPIEVKKLQDLVDMETIYEIDRMALKEEF